MQKIIMYVVFVVFALSVVISDACEIKIGNSKEYIHANTEDVLETKENIIPKSYLPTAYIIASGTDRGGITYGVGSRWKTSTYGGFGLEYRQFQPMISFNRREYRMKGNAAVAYLLLQSPDFDKFSIGLDFGGGILWDKTNGLNISETWVASSRINISKKLGQYFDLVIFAGANRIGSFTVSDNSSRGSSESQAIYDGGLAFRFYLGNVSENIQNYLMDMN